ncbi:hypothetical protein A4X13_0g7121 [Tilletia indica]|uniref:Uncharacterized protein n=1 Tax=Tilletia indica TaxID=43049 RepID=A0A177T4J0_9BASI|nr:hypothetical protein A4X13_0g7121 [Tilletia indica]
MSARSTTLPRLLLRALPARGIASSSSYAHASSSSSSTPELSHVAREDIPEEMPFDEDEDDNNRSNTTSAPGSLVRTAFVRSADGRIQDIHSALALARGVAFPRREGGGYADGGDIDGRETRRTSGSGSENGPKQESVLRDLTFAKSFEQRQYLGFASFTFSGPETLSSALKAQSQSLTPRKYYVPPLHQASQTNVREPLLSGRSLAMIGLADVAPLIGLPREEIVKVLGDEGRAGTQDEVEEEGEAVGKWVEYKLERRTSVKTARVRKRNPTNE